MRDSLHRALLAAVVIALAVPAVALELSPEVEPAPVPASAAGSGWRTDPAWHQGKAEWALYDAVRPIYGAERRYEATIFTNKQVMDVASTTKAAGSTGVSVFKHNCSEMIPTENYTYRFLTTAFVREADLAPYKLVMSSQEDCGATYKEFVLTEESVKATEHSYFPGEGLRRTSYRRVDALAFHDMLSLTLRDYPFEDEAHPVQTIQLIPDQTDTHATSQRPEEARVTYVAAETLDLPYGQVQAHRLRVTHPRDGGVEQSDFWFAADPAMRHVMVQYAGPYGVRYRLKRLAWWAYWQDPRPE